MLNEKIESTSHLDLLLKDQGIHGLGRRFLYEGFHRIPVFNIRVSDKPVLIPLAFQIYRVSHKVYIEALQALPA